ncbi:MAG: hypothetical protein AB7G28_12565 [Pirellulales bacterium]
MKVKRLLVFSLALLAAGVMASAPVRAAFVSVEATDNATVQPGGPRSGTSGKNFYNLEGSNNTTFASFGVADFVFPAPSGTVTGVSGVTLKLTQSNAGFSMPGPVSFYLTDNTGVSIQPGTPPAVAYQGSNDGAAAVDPVLSPLSLVGNGAYAVVANGAVDSYSLSFSGGALTSLLGAINSGTPLRLVMTADTASTAATWAGFGNSTYAGPTLELTTVPEPSAALLGCIGLVGLLVCGKRRS